MQVNPINNSYSYSNRPNSVAFKKIVRNNIPKEILANRKFVVCVGGPSSVGKNAVTDKMLNLGYFKKVITHTTRNMRPGEIPGVDYHFTTKEAFETAKGNNEFVESVQSFGGQYYGTKIEAIKDALAANKPALLVVDVDGARSIREYLKNDNQIKFVSIFFEPPSIGDLSPMDVLKERIMKRSKNTHETAESIKERLDNAVEVMKCKDEFDAVISFENPEEGIESMKQLLHLK